MRTEVAGRPIGRWLARPSSRLPLARHTRLVARVASTGPTRIAAPSRREVNRRVEPRAPRSAAERLPHQQHLRRSSPRQRQTRPQPTIASARSATSHARRASPTRAMRRAGEWPALAAAPASRSPPLQRTQRQPVRRRGGRHRCRPSREIEALAPGQVATRLGPRLPPGKQRLGSVAAISFACKRLTHPARSCLKPLGLVLADDASATGHRAPWL